MVLRAEFIAATLEEKPQMSIAREIEDIARDLIKHQHDHPPVRDINREVERRLTFADRARDLQTLAFARVSSVRTTRWRASGGTPA